MRPGLGIGALARAGWRQPGAWPTRAVWATMRGWLVMTAGTVVPAGGRVVGSGRRQAVGDAGMGVCCHLRRDPGRARAGTGLPGVGGGPRRSGRALWVRLVVWGLGTEAPTRAEAQQNIERQKDLLRERGIKVPAPAVGRGPGPGRPSRTRCARWYSAGPRTERRPRRKAWGIRPLRVKCRAALDGHS